MAVTPGGRRIPLRHLCCWHCRWLVPIGRSDPRRC
jgi:hypothetical protein